MTKNTNKLGPIMKSLVATPSSNLLCPKEATLTDSTCDLVLCSQPCFRVFCLSTPSRGLEEASGLAKALWLASETWPAWATWPA